MQETMDLYHPMELNVVGLLMQIGLPSFFVVEINKLVNFAKGAAGKDILLKGQLLQIVTMAFGVTMGDHNALLHTMAHYNTQVILQQYYVALTTMKQLIQAS